MATALNNKTGRVVQGDLVRELGEGFRDWKIHQLSTVGDWEINPTHERIAQVQADLAPSPEEIAAAEEAAREAARHATAKERAKRLIDGDTTGLSDEVLAIYYATLAQSKVTHVGISDLSGRTNRPTKTWDETKAAAKALIDAS